MTLALASGRSTITLPIRPTSERDALVRFEPAEVAPPVPTTELHPSRNARVHSVDFVSGVHRIVLTSDGGATRIDDRGIETSSRTEDTFEIHPDDPLSARLVSKYRWAIKSGEADTAAESRTELTATATHFVLTWRVDSYERGRIVGSQANTIEIPRDGC